MLGHSQRLLMLRYYMKYLGGDAKVHKFAALGAIQYGTTLQGLIPLLEPLGLYEPVTKVFDMVCLSCFQFLANSPVLREMSLGGDTMPGIE